MDVQQDAAVAAAHHQQGEDVQREEVTHVVERFLPAAAEAAVGGALSEVCSLHPDGPEDEELQRVGGRHCYLGTGESLGGN